MMDIAILCGGYGTRLAGLWDGPKALIPLGDGRPLLAHLLRRALLLHPSTIALLTGYGHDAIVQALRRESLLHPRLLVIHSEPAGTAAAIRQMQTPAASLMVLNGDTLPLYNLQELTSFARTAAFGVIEAYCGGKAAGTWLLSANAIDRLQMSTESDLDRWIAGDDSLSREQLLVSRGFLDVGTPEGFALAAKWTEI